MDEQSTAFCQWYNYRARQMYLAGPGEFVRIDAARIVHDRGFVGVCGADRLGQPGFRAVAHDFLVVTVWRQGTQLGANLSYGRS